MLELVQVVHSASKGKVIEPAMNNSVMFDLICPVGLIAIVASENVELTTLIRILILALLNGNGILLCTSSLLNSASDVITR